MSQEQFSLHTAEALGQASEQESHGIKSAIFIGGATSEMKGLGGIDSVLKGRFGDDNVSVYNSLLSPELSAPDRFTQMGADLKGKLAKGPLTVFAHSFGVAELYAAMNSVAEEDPTFFQQPEILQKLHLVLISPTLPKNLSEGLGIGARYLRIGVQEGGVLAGRTVPGKTRALRGIVSTNVVPVEGMSVADVQEAAREVAPKISHVEQGTSTNIIDFSPQRNYRESMTESDSQRFAETDVDFVEAMRQSRQEKAKAIYRRGVVMHNQLNTINKTDWSEYGDTQMEGTDNTFSADVLKTTGKLLKDTFVKGNVYDFITSLVESGVATKVVIPEFDTMITPEKARELNTINNLDVMIAAHTTHGFPWADQPELLLTLLDHQKEA